MMHLYDFARSSCCQRVRIALALKNVSVDKIGVNLLEGGGQQNQPAYLSINPQKLIPSLVTDAGSLTQSLAIIEYLEEKYPTPALLPTDPFLRAKIRGFALNIACEMHPLLNLRVIQALTNEFQLNPGQKDAWVQKWLVQGLQALEAILATQKTKTQFCFGDTPSLADVFLAPQLQHAQKARCDLTPYPKLMTVYAHCQKEAAFSTVLAEQ